MSETILERLSLRKRILKKKKIAEDVLNIAILSTLVSSVFQGCSSGIEMGKWNLETKTAIEVMSKYSPSSREQVRNYFQQNPQLLIKLEENAENLMKLEDMFFPNLSKTCWGKHSKNI